MQFSTTHALVISKSHVQVEKYSASGDKMPGKKLRTLSAYKLTKLEKTEPKAAVTEEKSEIASLKSVLSQPRSNKSIVYSARSNKKPEKLSCQSSRTSRASRPQSAVKPDTTERFSETSSKTLGQRSLRPSTAKRASKQPALVEAFRSNVFSNSNAFNRSANNFFGLGQGDRDGERSVELHQLFQSPPKSVRNAGESSACSASAFERPKLTGYPLFFDSCGN